LNDQGQLGQHTIDTELHYPVPISFENGGPVLAVAAGYGHVLAILYDSLNQVNALYGWGSNSSQQLVANGAANYPDPTQLMPSPSNTYLSFKAVAAGFAHSLAITDGWMLVGGDNSYGQLATNDNTSHGFPFTLQGYAEAPDVVWMPGITGWNHNLGSIVVPYSILTNKKDHLIVCGAN
jgi:alpha-tubulin suppressor-like RCC1 family protein